MRRLITFALFLSAAAIASAQSKPAIDKALAPFQGTWILTTPDGKSLGENAELAFIISGDTYAQSIGGTVNERGTLKLDATKKPAWIDLTIKEGTDAGKTQLGLIEVKGDAMTGIFSFPGDTTRPASLTATGSVIAFVGKKKAK
jgi:uncharacterized protein (TIGR03067 family)